MNLLSCFTPKSEVVCLRDTYTLRQAMEKMEKHPYAGLPLLDAENRYVGTITEGDILWFCKSHDFRCLRDAEQFSVREVPLHIHTPSVSVNTRAESLSDALLLANFIPVEDDRGCFIGIVTRKKYMKAMLRDSGIDIA